MSQPQGRIPTVTVDMLQENRLFGGVDRSALVRLQTEFQAEVSQPGEWIIREGDVADFMFVILNGELEVLSHGGGPSADVRVALLGPGDWVGEMAILDAQPQRSASVRALAPSLLVRMTVAQIQRLQDTELAVYAEIMKNIAREVARRLRVADRLIARTSAAMAKQYVIESRHPPKS